MQRCSIHVILGQQQCPAALSKCIKLIEALVEFVDQLVVLALVCAILAGSTRNIKLVEYILDEFYCVVGLFVMALSLLLLDNLLLLLLLFLCLLDCWLRLNRCWLLHRFL